MPENKDLDIRPLISNTLNAWSDKVLKENFYYKNCLETMKKIYESLPPSPPVEQEEVDTREPRYFAYFQDYDDGWMECYHTKKEALKAIREHKDCFDCLVKGKIIK